MQIPLTFDKAAPLKITIEANGFQDEVHVLLDTGYTSHGGHGLTLPMTYLDKFKPKETIPIDTAGEIGKVCPFIPDLRIKKIMDYQLRKDVKIPSVITGKFLWESCSCRIASYI